jgi:hypothetical protein
MTHDFWRDNIKCFELHTTMCQTDEASIVILNRMRTNNQTYDDLTYINSRCLRPAPTDPTFPYLFYTNKDVAMHNSHMLSLMPGDDIIINSIDLEEDNHGNVPRHEHTTTLPLQLVLKLEMLVEIYACNYDSQDGLVNGADGILKGYMKTEKLDVLWIKFHESHIGKRQASKLAYLYNSNIASDWTPILRISEPVSTLAKTGRLKIRKQFMIKLLCARIVHRSQGLTLDNVAFHPVGIRINGLVYIALSHVRSIDSLYLLSPLTKDNFKVKQKVDIAMERLRTTTKWKLHYDYQFIQTNSSVSILSLNTRNLNAHMNDILNDYDTMQSNILCLQETYIALCMQNKQFPNHNCISSYITHGVMILVKKRVPILDHIHIEEKNLEVVLAIFFSMKQKLQYRICMLLPMQHYPT